MFLTGESEINLMRLTTVASGNRSGERTAKDGNRNDRNAPECACALCPSGRTGVPNARVHRQERANAKCGCEPLILESDSQVGGGPGVVAWLTTLFGSIITTIAMGNFLTK